MPKELASMVAESGVRPRVIGPLRLSSESMDVGANQLC